MAVGERVGIYPELPAHSNGPGHRKEIAHEPPCGGREVLTEDQARQARHQPGGYGLRSESRRGDWGPPGRDDRPVNAAPNRGVVIPVEARALH